MHVGYSDRSIPLIPAKAIRWGGEGKIRHEGDNVWSVWPAGTPIPGYGSPELIAAPAYNLTRGVDADVYIQGTEPTDGGQQAPSTTYTPPAAGMAVTIENEVGAPGVTMVVKETDGTPFPGNVIPYTGWSYGKRHVKINFAGGGANPASLAIKLDDGTLTNIYEVILDATTESVAKSDDYAYHNRVLFSDSAVTGPGAAANDAWYRQQKNARLDYRKDTTLEAPTADPTEGGDVGDVAVGEASVAEYYARLGDFGDPTILRGMVRQAGGYTHFDASGYTFGRTDLDRMWVKCRVWSTQRNEAGTYDWYARSYLHTLKLYVSNSPTTFKGGGAVSRMVPDEEFSYTYLNMLAEAQGATPGTPEATYVYLPLSEATTDKIRNYTDDNVYIWAAVESHIEPMDEAFWGLPPAGDPAFIDTHYDAVALDAVEYGSYDIAASHTCSMAGRGIAATAPPPMAFLANIGTNLTSFTVGWAAMNNPFVPPATRYTYDDRRGGLRFDTSAVSGSVISAEVEMRISSGPVKQVAAWDPYYVIEGRLPQPNFGAAFGAGDYHSDSNQVNLGEASHATLLAVGTGNNHIFTLTGFTPYLNSGGVTCLWVLYQDGTGRNVQPDPDGVPPADGIQYNTRVQFFGGGGASTYVPRLRIKTTLTSM